MTEGKKRLGILLAESFSLWKETIGRLFILILSGIAISIICLIIFIVVGALAGIFSVETANPRMLLKNVNFLALGACLVAVITAIWSLYQIAVIKIIQAVDKKIDLESMAAFREARPIFWAYILVGLIVLVKIVLWSFLLIIPGIIFGIFYSFSHLAVILDGKRGQEALVYSKSIIKPNVGKFLGNSLVVFALLVLINIFVDKTKLFVDTQYVGNAGVSFMTSLLVVAIQACAGAYGTIFSYCLYKELKKETKEFKSSTI